MKIREEDFLGQVLQLAALQGWRRAHFRPAQTAKGWRTAVQGDGKGFPDLILLRGPKLLVAELKVPPNRLTQEQQEWLDSFRETGADVRVWTPDQWDEIEATLSR